MCQINNILKHEKVLLNDKILKLEQQIKYMEQFNLDSKTNKITDIKEVVKEVPVEIIK
jgi:hypothetical protein